jgi:SAM-dependent methyltransferase
VNSSIPSLLESVGLTHGLDGIWYATEQEALSYPSEGNDQCFEIEDKSFWFRHRNACIVELVKKFPPRGNGPIFDVGGGNGFVAKGLMDVGWDVVLVEPGLAGARNAKKRGLQHVVCATTQTAGFRPASMAAIGVFDVVEHIEDDVAFLKHLHELLEPSGMLYLTVPAFNFLWSEADVSAGHYRRYTLRSLEESLQAAGLEVAFDTYFFRVLPLTVFLFRSLPFRLGLTSGSANSENMSRTHGTDEGIMVRVMRRMLAPEANSLARGQSIAFGGSCLLAACKPPNGNGFATPFVPAKGD